MSSIAFISPLGRICNPTALSISICNATRYIHIHCFSYCYCNIKIILCGLTVALVELIHVYASVLQREAAAQQVVRGVGV